METGFVVGSRFVLVDEFSPALRLILKQVRELNVALDKARASLSTLGKFAMPTGLTAATAQTGELAAAWGLVAKNAGLAQRAIGSASTVAARTSLPAAAAAATGSGGGGRHRPGFLGRGGGVYGPSLPLPGGGFARMGGGAMAGAGLLGYGVYQSAQMEDAVFQLIYHAGLEQNDANRARFRKVIQDSMAESGYGLKDIAASAKQEVRMFQGTPGGGLDVLPEMLRAATIESRLKGSTPEESMRALIGLAHMTKQYSPEAIKKLAPAFAFLSTANPASLASIERAAGYAVPLLQSGLEIDPLQTLLLGTALTRAGATNTKSGTWLREMAIRAMPGTTLMTKFMYKKHEAALKELGLSDEKGKPTWFTDGKPDLLKMLDIGGAGAAKIPLERRAAIERSLFGAQGGGGFALLADPAVRDQVQSLRKTMDSPEFKNRYAGFTESYKQGSTVQAARTAMAEFNVTMMDIAKVTLPAVNNALGGFKSVLEGIRGIIPGGDGKGGAVVGGHAILGAAGGAALGAGIGAFGGPVGALGGALIGGAAGGLEGVIENYMRQQEQDRKDGGRAYERQREEMWKPRLRLGGSSEAAPTAKLAPVAFSLNIDGRALAQTVIEQMEYITEHATGSPNYNGLSNFGRADGGITTE
jgi:hypothetical protein